MGIHRTLLLICALAASVLCTENLVPSTRVVGGYNAPVYQYTYAVSIQNSYGHKCTGSILTPNYVLTAAHCCQSRPNYRLVLAGSHNTSLEAGGTQHAVLEFITPTEYTGADGGQHHDICLARLGNPIEIRPTATKTTLMRPAGVIPDGTSSTVMGWGFDDKNATHKPDWLQYDTGYSTYSTEFCSSHVSPESGNLTDYIGQLCVIGKQNETVCAGDSGGPLVNDNQIQMGVFSYYFGSCGTPYPDIYTNITHYLDWIIETVGIDADEIQYGDF